MTAPTPVNPYQAPQSEEFGSEGAIEVPGDFVGKLVLGLRLLAGNLPVIAPVVLTVWLPAHVLIEALVARSATPDDPFAALPLTNLVEAFFGPVISGAVICILAERLEGRRISYFEAMAVGVQNWGRLFVARLIASCLVLLGCLALIVPGIVLAVRYSLIDEVVVLEGASANACRARSDQLVRGKGGLIFLSGFVCFTALLTFAAAIGVFLQSVPALDSRWANIGVQCLINILSMLISCVLFLYYRESRGLPELASETKSDGFF